MKIAITGHTSGIGQALAKIYADQGHEIVGLSKRNGYDIRHTLKIADLIDSCDLFVNNAQEGYAQTELLYEMHRRWKGTANKKIMIISTMMTISPTPTLPGEDIKEYYNQKQALEQAVRQLVFTDIWPQMLLVKPGNVATSIKDSPYPQCDVDEWANKLIEIIELVKPNLEIYEISLSGRHG